MKPHRVHALDPSGGAFSAVCRARVTLTSDVTKDEAKVTCDDCRERLKCPGCGFPIPVSAAAVFAAGRRYHPACAVKAERAAPPTPAR